MLDNVESFGEIDGEDADMRVTVVESMEQMVM